MDDNVRIDPDDPQRQRTAIRYDCAGLDFAVALHLARIGGSPTEEVSQGVARIARADPMGKSGDALLFHRPAISQCGFRRLRCGSSAFTSGSTCAD